MLAPKRVKFRRQQRGRMKGKAYRGSTLAFGDYGLQALEPAWITAQQIEAARVAITRHVKRGGKVWIRIFPDKPVTKKPGNQARQCFSKEEPSNAIVTMNISTVLRKTNCHAPTILIAQENPTKAIHFMRTC